MGMGGREGGREFSDRNPCSPLYVYPLFLPLFHSLGLSAPSTKMLVKRSGGCKSVTRAEYFVRSFTG